MSQIVLSVHQGAPLEGMLLYSEEEYSFRFDVASPADLAERSGDLGRTSLAVGTLQIEIDVATGTALFVWGLHPRVRWSDHYHRPQHLVPGVVRAHIARGLIAGVSEGVADVGEWATTFDPVSGWVRVAPDDGLHDNTQILIASGTALGVHNGQLTSVWLLPMFEPTNQETFGD